jgi:hypothetical protein
MSRLAYRLVSGAGSRFPAVAATRRDSGEEAATTSISARAEQPTTTAQRADPPRPRSQARFKPDEWGQLEPLKPRHTAASGTAAFGAASRARVLPPASAGRTWPSASG